MESTNRKIILIKRKTRLEELVHRYNTIEQAKFVIEHSGSDFSDYVLEDQNYKRVITSITAVLEKISYVQILEREYISTYIFGRDDMVVAVGQDGLVANVLKYLDEQPLLGVNPDAKRYDGVLLPFRPEDLEKVMTEVIHNERKFKEVTLARVDLNDGQFLLGVNDIFIGPKSHTSAQYILSQNEMHERQSSSGIIVSTGLGATGWLKSILAGASKIMGACCDREIELTQREAFNWNSDFLYYTVREPYPSKWTSANMVFGKIEGHSLLKIQSLMPENGVIFSDGMESDYLHFNSGSEATISVAGHKGRLVV